MNAAIAGIGNARKSYKVPFHTILEGKAKEATIKSNAQGTATCHVTSFINLYCLIKKPAAININPISSRYPPCMTPVMVSPVVTFQKVNTKAVPNMPHPTCL